MEKRTRKRKVVDYNTDEEKAQKQKKTAKTGREENSEKVIKTTPKVTQQGWDYYESVIIKDNNSTSSDKILALDLDGTLIETKSEESFPIDGDDWKFIYSNKLQERLNEYHNMGYKIVIISNQSGMSNGKQDVGEWQKKLDNIVNSLKLPILVMASKEKDYFRKPSVGMWKLMIEKFNSIQPDLSKCIYVGDAAGREKTHLRKKDHSDSDYKFALNCGIAFKTPEEFFINQKEKIPKLDFNPKKYTGEEYKAAEFISDKKEIIVFVGSPGSGKTSFFKKYLEPNGYIHINQDKLKTQQKCIKLADQNLKEGKSVVIDCTNPAAKTRKVYLDLAKENNVQIRCFFFKYDKDLVMHLNNLRNINIARQHNSKSVADVIIHTWFKYIENPSMKEGFDEVKQIEFKPFFENEDDKKIFYMYS
jgi:bifunctional polynucleotide phosphatase/kinase